MKKTIFAGLIFILILVFLSGCINNDVTPNGKTIYNHVFMAVDETNMKEVVGSADYVFIGTVTGINQRVISNDFPQEYYAVRVEENLKGELWTDLDIEVVKAGGYSKNGTTILYESDFVVGTGLCAVGQKYVFIGFGQPDGSLLLDHLHGNMEYTDELKNGILDDIENQIDSERERFPSQYDPAYEN